MAHVAVHCETDEIWRILHYFIFVITVKKSTQNLVYSHVVCKSFETTSKLSTDGYRTGTKFLRKKQKNEENVRKNIIILRSR